MSPDRTSSGRSTMPTFEVGVWTLVETNTFGANWANSLNTTSRSGSRSSRRPAPGLPASQQTVGRRAGQTAVLSSDQSTRHEVAHAWPCAIRTVARRVSAPSEGIPLAVLMPSRGNCAGCSPRKAALVGARRAMDEAGTTAVLIAQITVETTGTILSSVPRHRQHWLPRAAWHRPHRYELRDQGLAEMSVNTVSRPACGSWVVSHAQCQVCPS